MATNRSLAAVVLLAVGLVVLLPVVATGLGGVWWGATGHAGPMDGQMAGSGHAGPGMGWSGGSMSWGGGWLGPSLGLLALLAVVGGGVMLLQASGASEGDPALAALRSAYARGDLTDEEFERRRSRLAGTDEE